jgi:hypothetical protein
MAESSVRKLKPNPPSVSPRFFIPFDAWIAGLLRLDLPGRHTKFRLLAAISQ